MNISSIFLRPLTLLNGVHLLNEDVSEHENQSQTNQAFTNKWDIYSKEDIVEQEKLFESQKEWYLTLYGFSSEADLAFYLKDKHVIIDAGSGLGYKAKWFADLSPGSLVIGIDYSDAVFVAADRYKLTPNLFFVKGDIADTQIKSESVDYVSCDQVIMHTENPDMTFKELVRILKPDRDFAVYVYAKKALPRELLDDYFRHQTKKISHDDMMLLSKQLTELGRVLSELNIEVDFPSIPLLGIKGGKEDLQRFIYWNFLKCYWHEHLGYATSVAVNYDWYSPSNAKRYSSTEFMDMVNTHKLKKIHFHSEEACYSGRFSKPCAV